MTEHTPPSAPSEDAPKKAAKDDPVATQILALLASGSALSLQDLAKQVAASRAKPKEKDKPDLWRRYLTSVRQQTVHLARQGRVEIVRKGEVQDPDDFRGLVKVRMTTKN